MRVVWATSNLPDPALGGGPSLEHELLRWASHHHDVTLITGGLAPGEAVPAAITALPVSDVVAAGVPPPRPPGRLGLLRQSVSGAPFEFRAAQPRVARLAELVAERPTDLVQVVWPESAPVAIDAARRGPTVFLPADSFIRHARRQLDSARTARHRVYWSLQLSRARTWERGYARAGRVSVVSPLDAAAMAELGVAATVVPTPLADSWFEPSGLARDGDRVAFVGALDYAPNVDAVQWLVDSIWPLVRRDRPTARLEVVGRRPGRLLVSAVEAAGGVVRADVDDVRPHYATAAVVIAPLRLGSGVRIKLLHAMASHAPLVANTSAIESLPLEPGRHLLVADDAAGLAGAVVATLADPVAASRRAEAAAVVAASHRSERVIGAFAALWDRAVSGSAT